MSQQSSFDFASTYVHIEDGPGAVRLEVGDDFWEKIATRTDLGDGRLVCLCRFDSNWPTWEMHPAGDEIVYLLSGSLDVILEEDGAERVVELRERAAAIVPRGIWHRAIVHRPSEMLHITRGAGTVHRPV
jgi:mannose-6-phosphate isomerase-like protein (cupin superfamily)